MSLEVFWRLPSNGDGRDRDRSTWSRGDYQGVPDRPHVFTRTSGRDSRINYFDHLTQVARAAELTGFDGVFIPQTDEGEEPLIVAGALAREVRRVVLAPQIPAHFLSAVYAAKIATSFQRLTGGRLALNLVTQDPAQHAWHGQAWSEDEQIARADEFLTVFKGFWNDGPYTFEGRYYEVLNGGFAGPLKGQPAPLFQLSGDSPAALALSAKHADVHVIKANTPEAAASMIAHLNVLAAEQGRSLRYALEAEIVSRHTAEEAAKTSDGLADPALAGDFAQVAARLNAYLDAGVDTLVLGAHPHLEEAYRTAQHVLPRLRGRVASSSIAAE